MRKVSILLLAVIFVILLACSGFRTATASVQTEHTRSAIPQVSCGNDFTAAVKADGTLWTWGYDQRSAQFGINTFRPGQVGRDTNWSTVSAGGNQITTLIAALKADGTLWVWGWPLRWDSWGLKMHLRDSHIISWVPAKVGNDRDWAAISVGNAHIAALKRDGTLWTWGANQHGQLGDGTTTSRNAPTQVGNDSDWAAVSAGGNHTAALKADGTLWTWGGNLFGQLGIGTGGDPRAYSSGRLPQTYADEYTPVRVGNNRWAAVSAGSVRTAAIKTDGTLWIWGMHGIEARGVDRVQVRPLRVGRNIDWASVSLGNDHAAAVKLDGTLWVWGNNAFGKLGIGIDLVPGRPGIGWPAQVGNDRDWAAVSVGTHHTAALKADGTLWTWGANQHGQLGDGTPSFRNAPALISLMTDNGVNTETTTPRTVKIYPRSRSNAVPAALGGGPVPFIENGRTLVPLRFIGEQLGAVVRFDSAKKEVTFTKGTIMIQLRLGEKSVRISQEGATPRTLTLDVSARAVYGRTMVPLRFVSEALGATVILTDVGTIIVRQ